MTLLDFFRLSLDYHCVAAKGGFVYDPERRKPFHIDDYDRSDWAIVSFYRPWSRFLLNDTRGMNEKKFTDKDRLLADLLEDGW